MQPFPQLPPFLSMATGEASTSSSHPYNDAMGPKATDRSPLKSSYAWERVFSEDYLAIGRRSTSISPERQSLSPTRREVPESPLRYMEGGVRPSSPSRYRDSNLRTRLQEDPDNGEKEECEDELQKECELEDFWKGINFRRAFNASSRQRQKKNGRERIQNLRVEVPRGNVQESRFQPYKLRMRRVGSEGDELLCEDAWQPNQVPLNALPVDRQAVATQLRTNGVSSIGSLFPHRKSVDKVYISRKKDGTREMDFYFLCEATDSLSTTGVWEHTGYCGQITKGHGYSRHIKTKHLGIERHNDDGAVMKVESWAQSMNMRDPHIQFPKGDSRDTQLARLRIMTREYQGEGKKKK